MSDSLRGKILCGNSDSRSAGWVGAAFYLVLEDMADTVLAVQLKVDATDFSEYWELPKRIADPNQPGGFSYETKGEPLAMRKSTVNWFDPPRPVFYRRDGEHEFPFYVWDGEPKECAFIGW